MIQNPFNLLALLTDPVTLSISPIVHLETLLISIELNVSYRGLAIDNVIVNHDAKRLCDLEPTIVDNGFDYKDAGRHVFDVDGTIFNSAVSNFEIVDARHLNISIFDDRTGYQTTITHTTCFLSLFQDIV